MFILEKNGCSHVDRSTTTQKKRLKKGEEKKCVHENYIYFLYARNINFVRRHVLL